MGDTISGATLRKMLLAGGLATGLAACTGTNDPSQAGFLDGVGNLASGTYDDRIEERERNLAATEASSSALQSELAQSEREVASLSAEEAALAGRVDAMDRNLRDLSSRIADARQRQGVDQQRLAEQQALLAQVQAAHDRIASSRIDPVMAAEVAELEQRQAEISRTIDDILLGAGPIE